MQISATTSVAPITAVDARAASTQPDARAQQTTKTKDADNQAKAEAEAAKKVFTPAPPLRPNIQDYVDINRTLIALRKI